VTNAEDFEQRDLRRRQARAQVRAEVGDLERALDSAQGELEHAAARLALGIGDEAAVADAESVLDGTIRDLRRARAAHAGLD
jgi:hypothetical protein